jgi:hypothetical protein
MLAPLIIHLLSGGLLLLALGWAWDQARAEMRNAPLSTGLSWPLRASGPIMTARREPPLLRARGPRPDPQAARPWNVLR